MSIKGRNSVANLRKTTIYNTKVDLDDDNVFTKFGLNRSIRFRDIEQKLNSDAAQMSMFLLSTATHNFASFLSVI